MATADEAAALVDAVLRDNPPTATDPRAFLAARFDAGLAWVWASRGEGGLGADAALQQVVEERFAAAGAPAPFRWNPIGIGMTGPTLLTHGTPEQRARYLRPLYSGDEVWCQLFSEPSAGSDVAGLSTRGRRDGDEWVVDGQKVWTSYAHVARRGLLIARTDPDLPKHNGLTAFVLDMRAPGVEVRPLRQLTGEAEFNEVWFTGARIPDSQRVGAVGEGWRVAGTTLMNERVSLGGALNSFAADLGALTLDAYRAAAARSGPDPVSRDRAVRLWMEAIVNRLTAERSTANGARGKPGHEGSVLKLADAETRQRVAEFVLDLQGAAGMLVTGFDMRRPELPLGDAATGRDIAGTFLRSRAGTIEGGTSEIMRNIIGERVLGLPGDFRVDKDIAWKDIPRG